MTPRTSLFITLTLAVLVGCGGGGNPSTPPPTSDVPPDLPDTGGAPMDVVTKDVPVMDAPAPDLTPDVTAPDVVVSDAVPDGVVPRCAPTQRACGDRCLDVLEDRANCGDCNRACAGSEVCVAGQCQASCPAGEMASRSFALAGLMMTVMSLLTYTRANPAKAVS